MAIGIWQDGEPLPDLPSLPSFSIHSTTNIQQIALWNSITQQEAQQRLESGSDFYFAAIENTTVAYGWVARQEGSVNELQLSFTLSPQECYLWDFQTFPSYRGRGIYSYFLQAIIRQEQTQIRRFWIMYKPGNTAAEKSIRRAGFQIVGDFSFTDDRVSGLLPFEQGPQLQEAAKLFKLPIIKDHHLSENLSAEH